MVRPAHAHNGTAQRRLVVTAVLRLGLRALALNARLVLLQPINGCALQVAVISSVAVICSVAVIHSVGGCDLQRRGGC